MLGFRLGSRLGLWVKDFDTYSSSDACSSSGWSLSNSFHSLQSYTHTHTHTHTTVEQEELQERYMAAAHEAVRRQ